MNTLPSGITAAITYERESHGYKISVDDQRRHNCAMAERLNLPVEKSFKDEVSASRYGRKAREDWEALKAYLRPGHMLIFWASSRAHRDIAVFAELRDLCASIGVPIGYSDTGKIRDMRDGHDRRDAGRDAIEDEHFSEVLSINVRRGKALAADAGKPSTRAPWGYKTMRRLVDEPPRWEQDPVEAPRIREAVRMLLAGETMYSVRKWIENTEGYVPTTLTNLKRGLLNPALAGLRVHQGKVVGTYDRDLVDPIITEDEHDRLVDQLEQAPAPRPGREPKHLLSGIAKCGKCGEGLQWRKWSKGNRRPSYSCNRGHVCREVTSMDSAVERELFRLIPIIAATVPKSMFAPNTKEAERQSRALEKSLKEWRQAAIKGEVTPASFAEIEQGLLVQIEQLRPKAPPKIRIPDPATVQQEWAMMDIRERRDQIRFWLKITAVPAARQGQRNGKLLIEPGQGLAHHVRVVGKTAGVPADAATLRRGRRRRDG
jgi:site-specific DNA recombinase